MVKILKYPDSKPIRIFRHICGCDFQADFGDFDIYTNDVQTTEDGTGIQVEKRMTYGIKCPFCHVYSIYDDKNSEYGTEYLGNLNEQT